MWVRRCLCLERRSCLSSGAVQVSQRPDLLPVPTLKQGYRAVMRATRTCKHRQQGFQARGLVVSAPGSNVYVLEATRLLDVSLSSLKLYYNVMSPCIFFSKKMVPCVPYARADNKDQKDAQIASFLRVGQVRQQLFPSRIPPPRGACCLPPGVRLIHPSRSQRA